MLNQFVKNITEKLYKFRQKKEKPRAFHKESEFKKTFVFEKIIQESDSFAVLIVKDGIDLKIVKTGKYIKSSTASGLFKFETKNSVYIEKLLKTEESVPGMQATELDPELLSLFKNPVEDIDVEDVKDKLEKPHFQYKYEGFVEVAELPSSKKQSIIKADASVNEVDPLLDFDFEEIIEVTEDAPAKTTTLRKRKKDSVHATIKEDQPIL